jgi:hypothetical protein
VGMAKVYVSSTIVDLEAERQAVIDWLVAAQHQVVHSYRPNSDTVRESCLDDVDTCDVYVLIAGHRYGYQPTGNNPEGLSITHPKRPVTVEPGGREQCSRKVQQPVRSTMARADPSFGT